MGRPRRIQFEGAFYHIYNRGVEKRPIFMEERDRKAFLQFLADAVAVFHLRLIAYCLMENHYHLFLQTLKANLQSAMQTLQGKYSQYINFRYDRVGPLFQGRYNSRLVHAEQYALILTRYIHRNPLEAGLVQQMADYPWSSYPCYTGKLPRWNWLDTEWVLRQFDNEPLTARRLFIEFQEQKPPLTESLVLANSNNLTGA